MENETFSCTYSAKEQNEIMNIRKKYISSTDKMEHLRQLDASVTEKAVAASIGLGIIGAMVLGLGMCCTLVWQGDLFIPGIIIGIVGMAALALAYPIYLKVFNTEHKKIAPEILRLADELMK